MNSVLSCISFPTRAVEVLLCLPKRRGTRMQGIPNVCDSTLGYEMAYELCPLSGFSPICASVYLPANGKLELHPAVWVR